jgi:hypothetical protein
MCNDEMSATVDIMLFIVRQNHSTLANLAASIGRAWR